MNTVLPTILTGASVTNCLGCLVNYRQVSNVCGIASVGYGSMPFTGTYTNVGMVNNLAQLVVRFRYNITTKAFQITTYDGTSKWLTESSIKDEIIPNVTLPSNKLYLNITYSLNPFRALAPLITPQILLLPSMQPDLVKIKNTENTYFGPNMEFPTVTATFDRSIITLTNTNGAYLPAQLQTFNSNYVKHTFKLFTNQATTESLGVVIWNSTSQTGGTLSKLTSLPLFLTTNFTNGASFSINNGVAATASLFGTWSAITPSTLLNPIPVFTISGYITVTVIGVGLNNSLVTIEYTNLTLATFKILEFTFNLGAGSPPNNMALFMRTTDGTTSTTNYFMHVPRVGF